jgi:hypothetical protein
MREQGGTLKLDRSGPGGASFVASLPAAPSDPFRTEASA